MFFQKAFFPSLRESSSQIHCRSDYRLYAAAHFFITRHYRTLKNVKLMFMESLTLLSCFDLDPYARDIQEMMSFQRREIENHTDYNAFLKQAGQIQLEVLHLWLLDSEEYLNLSKTLFAKGWFRNLKIRGFFHSVI